MTEATRAVFLSYASQDADAARRICDALRAAGIEVWFDQSELRGGDAWDRKIRKEIHDCALFIPIISTNSQARAEGYFRREWKLAVDRTHDMSDRVAFLVPIAIDDTADQDADVPDKFREVQWTRLPAGHASPAFVERVSRLLSPDPAHAPRVSTSPAVAPKALLRSPAVQTRTASRARPVLWLIAVLAVIGVGYLSAHKFTLSKRSAASAPLSAPPTAPPAPVSSTIPEKSIAVLPFVDLSEKQDQEYFADGMSEEVLDLLTRIPSLKVIGRTSSFQFKGKSQDLRAIGRTLGAAYIVEGSVRKSGDHLRVTAQLIDARDGSQHWSSTYDRRSTDVLELQDAIAVNLARALQLTVSSDFGSRTATSSTEAYDVYLRGLHALDEFSQESTEQAAANFQQALDLDPSFAAAALGLAMAFRARGEEGWLLPTSAAFEQARVAANLAVRLDPKLGAAHAVLADIHVIYDWDWKRAELEIEEAFKLGGRIETLQAAARLAAVRGQWDQATQFLERGLAADPLNVELITFLAFGVDLRSGQFARAESRMRRALEINPTFGSGRWFLGLSLLFQHRLDEALVVMQQETSYDGQLEGTALVYHAMGKKAQSDAALKRAIAENAEEWPSAIAKTYAFRGERDQAMAWLERAYSAKDEDLYFIKGDPLMKGLEDDPRYRAFLLKMHLP